MRVTCPTCHAEYKIDERRVPPGGLNVRCPKCQGAFPVRPPQGSGVPLPVPESVPPFAAPRSPATHASATVALPSPLTSPPGTGQGFSEPEPAPSEAPPPFPSPEVTPASASVGLPSPFAPPPGVAQGFAEPELAPPGPTIRLPSPFTTPPGVSQGFPESELAPPGVPQGFPESELAPPGAEALGLAGSPWNGKGQGGDRPSSGTAPLPAAPVGGDGFPPDVGTSSSSDDPFAQPVPTLSSRPERAGTTHAGASAPPEGHAPFGFGEVDFGEDPSPVLGHADEPFPFETESAAEPPGFPSGFQGGGARPDALAAPGARDDPFGPGADAPEGNPFAEGDRSRAPMSDAGRVEEPAEAPAAGSLGGLGALGAKETEELEMLFDEGAGRTARSPAGPPAQVARQRSAGLFKVRRRSGKVFGPFTEVEVVEMLGKGELLGNEEVSADEGATFEAFGTVPAFGEAMRRLMEAPGPIGGTRSTGAASKAEEQHTRKATLASRMAPIRLVEGMGRLAETPRLKLAVAGGALAVVLAVGLGAGLTPYGAFFYRLALGQTGAHRPGAKLLVQARGRLAEDGFAGVKGALDLADGALRIQPSDREAKALYTYAASLLARRHGGAAEVWARAKGFLPELATRVGDDPDAAKAVLSASLLPPGAAAADAAAALQRRLAKDPRDEDALLVLGDAALARPDLDQAAALYTRLDALRPGTARAMHALGVTAARRGDTVAAQKALEAALSKDPRHLSSAMVLAQLALASGEVARAGQYAQRVLAPEQQGQAGPTERAQARVVLGQAMARTPSDELEKRLAEAEKELEAATREDPENLEARLALAGFELERNAPEKASAALAPMLAATAREPRLASVQARALAGQGRVLDALRLLDGALEKSPGDARLLFSKGLVVYQGGKRADGEKLWAEAVARAPGAWEPRLALGRAKLARGEIDEAEKELKLAADKAPAEGAVLTGMADLSLARKDLAGAEQGYRRALAVAPAHAEAHFGLARVALARGDGAAAQAALERTLRLEPRLAAAQAVRGELLWKARDLAGAKKALQAAVTLDPRDGVSRGWLGAVEVEAGDIDAALTDLLAASNLEMGSAEIRGWYARALLAKGEVPQSIEQLHKTVELDPRDARHQLQLGQALERSGNLQEAMEAYRAAQALAPEAVESYEALAALHASQNRCADALRELDKAIALAPREQRLRVASADCKVRLGKHAEAVTVYRRALQADPKLVGLYYKIARAEHEAAGRARALPWYERAAREEPRNPMPHYYLGFAYKERGQRSKAIEAFQAYLRAKPDAEDRKDIEREIEDLGGSP